MYRDPMREALGECIEDFADALSYVPQYFADKHGYAGALAKARAALAAPSAVEEMIAFVDKIREADLEGYYMPSWMGKEARALIAKYGAANG